jgi:tetratricopeptide (TPR) repeat protein
MNYEYDFNGAERECKRAIELDPNSSSAHGNYADYLTNRGRFDEAIAEMKIARDIEPASLIREAAEGINFLHARRYEEAVTRFKRVIAMNEDFGAAYPFLYTTLSFQGKFDEAFEWYMKLQDADKETIRSLRTIYKESGWRGILQVQVKSFEEGDQAYYWGAGFNAQVGNKDKAFEYLEKAYQRRESRLVQLRVDPRFDNLRDDSRFDELLRRIGLK